MNNKDLNKCIDERINIAQSTTTQGRYGVVTSYDYVTHTATVICSGANSEIVDEIFKGVPCPVMLGIQSVAPEPGRPCWVVFKDGKMGQPLISHYYNHRYMHYDFQKQTYAPTSLPSYFTEL